jgi:WD40 repeat protein
MIASGSEDKTVEIRNPEPGKRQVVLEGHTGTVAGVSFSADSQFLASKAKDGTVRLWRCGTWEIVATVEEPNSDWWAAGVTFHPQTMTLATLGEQSFASADHFAGRDAPPARAGVAQQPRGVLRAGGATK